MEKMWKNESEKGHRRENTVAPFPVCIFPFLMHSTTQPFCILFCFISLFFHFLCPLFYLSQKSRVFHQKMFMFQFFLKLCCHSKFFPTRVALVQNIIPSYFRKKRKMLFRLLNRFGSNCVECAPITLL
jgi:hypothetical protein